MAQLAVEEVDKDDKEKQVEDERGQEEEGDLPAHELIYALLQ